MSEDPRFGALLRRYRQAASLSQAALAERAQLSANAIAALERGRRGVPRPTTVLLLADALGLGPADRVKLIDAAGAGRSSGSPSNDSAVSPLPTLLTSFVGREQELTDVRELLARSRLLTLTGVGGIGKTRLALEAARTADEVAFVELAAIAGEGAVPHTVAAALGVREQPQRPILDTLAAALRPKRLLLVLDNCEHLVATCAELVDVLLRACPTLRVLATSREPLGIGGEVLWQVPSLSLPTPQAQTTVAHLAESEAVQLFIERAQSVRSSFSLTEHNARAVADICAKLDGIPLAIELAAARILTLTAEQIAERLDDRFRLLGRAHGRTAPGRHQTLRAAIDWSYELLSPDEQDALAQLSVFAGGWTLEAAEKVCVRQEEVTQTETTEVLDVLSGLVDKSLVLAEARLDGVRYSLLETIRQYASERLEVMPGAVGVRERHRDWYLTLGQRALSSYWWGTDLLVWLARLEREQANFRAALRFSLERGDADWACL